MNNRIVLLKSLSTFLLSALCTIMAVVIVVAQEIPEKSFVYESISEDSFNNTDHGDMSTDNTFCTLNNTSSRLSSTGSSPVISDIFTNIMANHDEMQNGYYIVKTTDSDGIVYKICFRDDLGLLVFSALDNASENVGHLDFDYTNMTIKDRSSTWHYIGTNGLNIIHLEMFSNLNQSTYKLGNILNFKYSSNMNSGYFNGNIQRSANTFYKKCLTKWDALLKAKTNHGFTDLGFVHFEENSTDNWDSYFATKTEHFTSVREGEQEATPENKTNSQSIWKKTSVIRKDRNGNITQNYKICLEESYCGDAALTKVKNENRFNTDPSDEQQWVLFKLRIDNNGTEEIAANDVLTTNAYCDSFSKSKISRTALSLTKDWKDMSRSTVVIQPGASAYVWDGILMSKTAGFPNIKLSVGYKNSKEQFTYLSTDPDYYRTESTVTFNANGGTTSFTIKTLGYGDVYGTLPTALKEEETFSGWFTEVNGGIRITEATIFSSVSNITVYAHWGSGSTEPTPPDNPSIPSNNHTEKSSQNADGEVVTVSDNKPMDYYFEEKGDLGFGYCHSIPFWGKSKLTAANFGKITISYNGIEYYAEKVKINKKKHLIQIKSLLGADKETNKAIRNITKGANGLSFIVNPYYISDRDQVYLKKGKDDTIKSVKVDICGKPYKIKNGEWNYNATEETLVFSGNNVNGKKKVEQ